MSGLPTFSGPAGEKEHSREKYSRVPEPGRVGVCGAPGKSEPQGRAERAFCTCPAATPLPRVSRNVLTPGAQPAGQGLGEQDVQGRQQGGSSRERGGRGVQPEQGRLFGPQTMAKAPGGPRWHPGLRDKHAEPQCPRNQEGTDTTSCPSSRGVGQALATWSERPGAVHPRWQLGLKPAHPGSHDRTPVPSRSRGSLLAPAPPPGDDARGVRRGDPEPLVCRSLPRQHPRRSKHPSQGSRPAPRCSLHTLASDLCSHCSKLALSYLLGGLRALQGPEQRLYPGGPGPPPPHGAQCRKPPCLFTAQVLANQPADL